MSPIRKLSLAYRSPTTPNFPASTMDRPSIFERVKTDESLPVSEDVVPIGQTPLDAPPLSPKHTEPTSNFETPKRKESLRDRRARQRQAQSQRSSYDTLNSMQPASPVAQNPLPIPPVTTIVPPPADLAIPHLPIENIPTIATSPASEPKSGEISMRSIPSSGRSMPPTMDARKLTRIAQAMGLVSTGPSMLAQSRHIRSKWTSMTDRSINHRKVSAHGALTSPTRSGLSAASTSRIGRAHGAGRAAGLGGRGHLIQVIPPDHLFVPSGFSPAFNLEDPSEKFDSSIASSSHEKELRRWRRGRLLPLRGTMDGMIKDIVTEWGLPSGIGMTLYLVDEEERPFSTLEEERDSHDYEGGMKCSLEAWRILWADLFNPANVRLPSSRYPSPRGPVIPARNGSLSSDKPEVTEDLTDDPNANPFQANTNQKGLFEGFLTPASARSFQLYTSDPGNSPGHRSSLAPSASASQTNSPPRKRRQDSTWTDNQTSPTSDYASRNLFQPMQRPSRIVGKVEFDFDRDRAKWYEAWRKRKQAAYDPPLEGGLKKLKLGTEGKDTNSKNVDSGIPSIDTEQANMASTSGPIYATPRSPAASDADRSVEQSLPAYAQLDDEPLDEPLAEAQEDEVSEYSADNISPDDVDEEFAILRADRLVNDKSEFGWDDIGSNVILRDEISNAELAGQSAEDFTPSSDLQEVTMLLAQRSQSTHVETPMLSVPDEQNTGLASPINLPSPNTVTNDRNIDTPSLSFTPAEDHKLSIETSETAKPAMFGLGMGLDMVYDKRGSSLVMSDQLDLLEKGKSNTSESLLRS